MTVHQPVPEATAARGASAAPRRRPCPDHWLGADPWYPGVDLALDAPVPGRPAPRGTRPAAPCRPGPQGRRPPVRLTRRGRRVVATGVAAVAVTGLVLVVDGVRGDGPPQPAAAAAPARQPSGPQAGAHPSSSAAPVRPLPYSPPTRIRIPSIGVDAPLMRVGVNAKGEIGTPPAKDTNLAAWFDRAASPGAYGTAVIVGHVDNTSGPSVFFSLGAMKKGGTIEVPRQDGRTAVFTVYGAEVFPRDGFPGERVYGPTGHAELRVITCGGGYSRATGYTANVVVFARLAGTR